MIDQSLGFNFEQRESTGVATINPKETVMHVIYRGKKYEVLYPNFCGDWSEYSLKSHFSDGSMFPAKKTDCRPVAEGVKRPRQGSNLSASQS